MRRNDQAVSGDKDCHRMTAIINSRVTKSAETKAFLSFSFEKREGRDGLRAAKIIVIITMQPVAQEAV